MRSKIESLGTRSIRASTNASNRREKEHACVAAGASDHTKSWFAMNEEANPGSPTLPVLKVGRIQTLS